MRDAEHDIKNRLRACELICQACGDFLDKASVQIEKIYPVADLMMDE